MIRQWCYRLPYFAFLLFLVSCSTAEKIELQTEDYAEMVLVPAGEFWMGCNEDVDKQCDSDEHSGRRVYLDSFQIEKYEVTVADYRRCVEDRRCSSNGLTSYFYCTLRSSSRDDHPINCVDWDQAKMYCEWTGKRLPTEAEWEKAARGTDGRRYPWGNEWDSNKANVGSRNTRSVGSYSTGVSSYGVHNMAGNVREWVADWYDEGYYQRSSSRNPRGPSRGFARVLRGGSWHSETGDARASDRNWNLPRSNYVGYGFRCAR